MGQSCTECGFLVSAHMPSTGGNRLLICEECLRVVCEKCAKKKRMHCPNKHCGSSKLRPLTEEELD